MSAQELLRSGNLKEAAAATLSEVRANPTDVRRRTFLFELLCFSGEFDRAAKHLQILADQSADAAVGALLYRSALAAAQQREANFEGQQLPEQLPALNRPGTLNGRPFETIEDCDPRIGPRLEVFVAGECVWLPFKNVGSVHVEPPRFLRDTIWPTAQVTTGPELKAQDFGEVLLPVLYPASWRHPNDAVKLGRETVWEDKTGTPFGQKLLLLDGEHVTSYLEMRELRFFDAEELEQAATA